MDQSAWTLTDLFREELTLCKVSAGEQVAVLTDQGSTAAYVDAAVGAIYQLGAIGLPVGMPQMPQLRNAESGTDRQGRSLIAPSLTKLLCESDLVVDFSRGGLLYTSTLGQLLRAGTRVLRVRASEKIMRRLFPHELVVRRAQAGAALLRGASQVRLRSPAGTDLTMTIGNRPVLAQYGYADEPGRWDSWGTGGVLTTAMEETVNGIFVIEAGDIVLPFRQMVRSPISCRFEGGKITRIEGAVDAEMMREYFLSWPGDDAVTRVGHIGWGLEHRSRWVNIVTNEEPERTADARFFYGNIQMALGRNVGIGGSNDCVPHTDIVLRSCGLDLDGVPVVIGGRIVSDE